MTNELDSRRSFSPECFHSIFRFEFKIMFNCFYSSDQKKSQSMNDYERMFNVHWAQVDAVSGYGQKWFFFFWRITNIIHFKIKRITALYWWPSTKLLLNTKCFANSGSLGLQVFPCEWRHFGLLVYTFAGLNRSTCTMLNTDVHVFSNEMSTVAWLLQRKSVFLFLFSFHWNYPGVNVYCKWIPWTF